MAKRSRIPSSDEHAALWAKMAFQERRRILKAVNRGAGLDSRKDARVGVGAARQQQRYWKWAWLVGPVMGLIQIPNWGSVIVTAVLGGMLMGALSVYRLRRAREAEQANLRRLGVS